MSKFQAPRGTHDVLPRDHLWWRVIRTIEEQCSQYGWSRVSTPGFEETALFERTSGEASDVVHKEMYSLVDRGNRSLTLRPEGTAPIVRAYVEHGLAQEPQPVKAYTIAPMYRYSRPGRGRYREHWQLSLEAIGSADPAVDAEVIQFYSELLRRLVEAVGGPATPGIGFGAGLERLLLAMEREGATAEAPGLDVFVAFEQPELRGRLLPQIAEWRAAGRSVDTDYAGRSMKGQLTQAQRLGAETVVVARSDGTYEVRRRGEEDRVVHTLAEL